MNHRTTESPEVSVVFESRDEAISALCQKVFGAVPSYPTLVPEGVVRALQDESAGDDISLRDYFAGQALAGMLAYYNGERGDFHTNSTPERNAAFAYEQADAMLTARNQ